MKYLKLFEEFLDENIKKKIKGIDKKINFPIDVKLNEESLNAKAEFDLDMLSFEFPHLVKTHQKSPEDKKTGPSNLVTIAFDISASLLN